ncbi:MAG: sigma-54-dependent Fis family transcriptional regulator, partial [Nitrospirae bacterium]|nr:sigma-54-dependent Fis family transcriptional regulator [Nitrospirota bacterium]
MEISTVKEVLVIERDETTARVICNSAGLLGYGCARAYDVPLAMETVKECGQIIFLSMGFDGGEGIELMKKIKALYPDAVVVAVVMLGDREGHVAAMKHGAYCYLSKPVNREELKAVMESAWREKSVREEISTLRSTIYSKYLPRLHGRSRKMSKALRAIESAAGTDTDVLLTGERGVGKELAARCIHYGSCRKDKPFVTFASNTIPKDLLDLILFGSNSERHIETDSGGNQSSGAVDSGTPAGIIYRVEGGTLYVDEIANLDMALQERLLKFLHARDSLPLKGADGKAKARIIAATEKNLKEAVAGGLFHEELYDRLKHHEIKIPPLRERKEDIQDLAEYFVERASNKYEVERKEFSKSAKKIIAGYEWPGNVGELQKIVHRAVLLSRGNVIEAADLMMDRHVTYSLHEFLEDKLKLYLKEISEMEGANLYETIVSEV